jgi:hypothetical protein
MVARLKFARQCAHWIEVAWQVRTNKTQFHRLSFRFVILVVLFRCWRPRL